VGNNGAYIQWLLRLGEPTRGGFLGGVGLAGGWSVVGKLG